MDSVFERLDQAVAFIRAAAHVQGALPKVGLILGSGLGGVAHPFEILMRQPYGSIPHFLPPAIEGHTGELLLARHQDIPLWILRGRTHAYEGHPLSEVTFPVRVMTALGVQTLILTNAAGGIHEDFHPGDLMFIEDHLNLTGTNPLIGVHHAAWGPRFLDLTEAYDHEVLDTLKLAAQKASIRFLTGVYAAVSGPTYETPAEVRMFRTIGADAVGMSTVTECIVARHGGLRVGAISCITNLAAGLATHHLSHEEVVETGATAAERIARLLQTALTSLHHLPPKP